MTKEQMLREITESGCHSIVVSHYEAAGYTHNESIVKTIEYFGSRMTKSEVKELYDGWKIERSKYFSGGVA